MPRKPKPGERYIVASSHPNAFETEIPWESNQYKEKGLLRSGGGIQKASVLARYAETWARLYEAEFVDCDPHDGCPRFKPIRRLRVSLNDRNEVPDDGTAPGLEEVTRYLNRETDTLLAPNEADPSLSPPAP